MDYETELHRHRDWNTFLASSGGRVILFTTKADGAHTDFSFKTGDILLLGREGGGVPPDVHDAADARVRVPLSPQTRSLNLAVAAGIALAEASRQLRLFK